MKIKLNIDIEATVPKGDEKWLSENFDKRRNDMESMWLEHIKKEYATGDNEVDGDIKIELVESEDNE